MISVDPGNQLSLQQKEAFTKLNNTYDSVFDPKFGAYNDFSGTIRAQINMGPIKTQNLQLLQEEADKLEQLGVLAKPEDLNITVQYTSPKFSSKEIKWNTSFCNCFQ